MGRIVVTGGAGFLGSHLCQSLLDRGDEVVCVDNLVTGTWHNVNSLKVRSGFQFLAHDISMSIKIAGPVDAVLHFASPASPVDYLRMPIQTLKAGSRGTHNALGLAMVKNAKFLLASTSEVYGDPQEHPQAESYRGHVDPVEPRGVYDEAKRFAEAMTMAYHRYHAVDTRIARIFNTYGPRMRPSDGRVVSNFIVAALAGEPLTVFGDGTQTRSFCYVDDLVSGLLGLVDSDVHEPVNFGNPDEITIRRLADLIIGATASSSVIVYGDLPVGDPVRRCPDIEKARRLLGWSPQIPLSVGLARTTHWFERSGTTPARSDARA